MGRATAMLFADEGARVVVADLGADRVAAVVDEINDVHGPDRAIGVACDVADHAQLRCDWSSERLSGVVDSTSWSTTPGSR